MRLPVPDRRGSVSAQETLPHWLVVVGYDANCDSIQEGRHFPLINLNRLLSRCSCHRPQTSLLDTATAVEMAFKYVITSIWELWDIHSASTNALLGIFNCTGIQKLTSSRLLVWVPWQCLYSWTLLKASSNEESLNVSLLSWDIPRLWTISRQSLLLDWLVVLSYSRDTEAWLWVE